MSKKQKHKGQGFVKATSIMAIFSLIASLLGFVRNIIMSTIFGMGIELDSYYAAFRVPDFIYMILVGGALSSAFIPVFSTFIANDEEEKGHKMASTILNLVMVFAIVLSLIGEIFTPQLINLTTKFSGEKFALTVKLTRIMFFQCFFMCLTGVAMGICQSYKNFVPTSIGSVFYNLSIIVFGVLFSQIFHLGIAGFSISVVCGALFNFLVHVGPIKREGFKYYPTLNVHNEGVKRFFALFWPMLFGISVTQINLLVNQYFASGLRDSVISAMSNAQVIMEMPNSLFAGSIAITVFPMMSEHYAVGDREGYLSDFSLGMRTTLFISIPCTFGLIAVSNPLVKAMFFQGKFSNDNLSTVSTLLIFYSLGIVGYSLRQVLLRAFYSAQDTRTPVRINIVVLTTNIILSYIFVKLWREDGLAIAYSMTGILSMTLLTFFLHRKLGKMKGREIFTTAVKSLISGVIMFLAIYVLDAVIIGGMFRDAGKIGQVLYLMIMISFGIIVYAISAVILKMQEVNIVLDIVKKKLHKA